MFNITIEEENRQSKESRWGFGVELLSVIAEEAVDQSIQTAFDGLSMTFQSGLAPPVITVLIADLDEEPARQHPEIFN